MSWLVIFGALISGLGIIGLVLSAVKIMRARQAGLEDAELRTRVQSAMVLNMGALFLSMIGLMMVVVGILLG